MGGTIAVTLREPIGMEHRMLRWTNSMPYNIVNMKLLRHDMHHVADYMKAHQEMKEDYYRNKDTGKFEVDSTGVYFPSTGLAPCGYGLVVVDMIKDVILEMQSYCSFNSIGASTVMLDLPDDRRFKAFCDAGRVIAVQKNFSEGAPTPIISDFDTIIEDIKNPPNRPWFDEYYLDMSPFVVETFEENADGLRSMRKRILELGFNITTDEQKIWDEWVQDCEEEDLEVGDEY